MAGNFFTDPIQLFGFTFIIVTMSIQLILALKVYRDYLMNRLKPTLAFSLTFTAFSPSKFSYFKNSVEITEDLLIVIQFNHTKFYYLSEGL